VSWNFGENQQRNKVKKELKRRQNWISYGCREECIRSNQVNRLQWFGHVERISGNKSATDSPTVGTRGSRREGKTQRKMDGWKNTEYV